MRKIYYIILIGLVFGISSCKEKDDIFLYDGPNYVSFIDANSDFTAIGGVTNEFTVEIGVSTTKTSKSYTIEVDAGASTGIEGTHFTLDTKEITIAAGEAVGTMTILPIFDAIPDDGISIVFNIVNTGDTAAYSVMSHTTTIGKLCEVDFAGSYTGTHGAHAATVVVEAT